jgi:hypothetical protein
MAIADVDVFTQTASVGAFGSEWEYDLAANKIEFLSSQRAGEMRICTKVSHDCITEKGSESVILVS